jgi:hypothetical protein
MKEAAKQHTRNDIWVFVKFGKPKLAGALLCRAEHISQALLESLKDSLVVKRNAI